MSSFERKLVIEERTSEGSGNLNVNVIVALIILAIVLSPIALAVGAIWIIYNICQHSNKKSVERREIEKKLLLEAKNERKKKFHQLLRLAIKKKGILTATDVALSFCLDYQEAEKLIEQFLVWPRIKKKESKGVVSYIFIEIYKEDVILLPQGSIINI